MTPPAQNSFASHPRRDWAGFASTLTDQVREEVRVDTARAQQLADLAITVAETIGNQLALAKSLRAQSECSLRARSACRRHRDAQAGGGAV